MANDTDILQGATDTKTNLALRVALVVGFVAFISLGPLGLLIWGPVQTRSSVPPPKWSFEAFRSGEYTQKLEKWMQERCPTNYTIRGLYNEALLRAGWLHNDRVTIRDGNWMFLSSTLHPTDGQFRQLTEMRRKHFLEVARRSKALGVPVVVTIVPDRATVRPDKAYHDGEVPAAKQRNFVRLVQEVKDCGLEVADIRGALRASVERGESTVYERDSHWNLDGAEAAAQSIRGYLQRNHADRLAPRLPVQTQLPDGIHIMPGLVDMLGLRTIREQNQRSPHTFVRTLEEHTRRPGVTFVEDGRRRSPNPKRPDAAVLLVGTSFSPRLVGHLSGAMANDVNDAGVLPSRGPLGRIYDVLDDIEKGTLSPKLIVWEFVERHSTMRHSWRRNSGPE